MDYAEKNSDIFSLLTMDIQNKLIKNYKIENNQVHFIGNGYDVIIPETDLNTFQVLGDYIAKDKNNVYYVAKIISGADASSFQFLNSFYSKDKNNVYCFVDYENDIGDVLTGADVSTFEVLTGWYAKDKNKVYWGLVEIGANAKTFQALNEAYSIDKNNVYCYSYPICRGIIAKADLDTFMVLSEGCAKDKNNVYYFGEIKNGINPLNCTKKKLSSCGCDY